MIPYRDDNPTQIVPVVTYALIGLNVAIFLLTFTNHNAAVLQLGTIPWEVLTGQRHPDSSVLGGFLSLFTSMFMHGGFMHLGGNMLFLWVFGNNIEDAMGHGRFLVFYLLSGLFAHAVQLGNTWFQVGAPPEHSIPFEVLFSGAALPAGAAWFVPTVGASGAISGILAAYYMLYRGARVHMLVFLGFIITTIRVSAGFAIGYWFVIQIFSGITAGGTGGGVAWWAHIGGFVGGYLIYSNFLNPRYKNHRHLQKQWKQMRRDMQR